MHHGCSDGGEGVIVTEFFNLPDFLGAFSIADMKKILLLDEQRQLEYRSRSLWELLPC